MIGKQNPSTTVSFKRQRSQLSALVEGNFTKCVAWSMMIRDMPLSSIYRIGEEEECRKNLSASCSWFLFDYFDTNKYKKEKAPSIPFSATDMAVLDSRSISV